MRAVIEKLIYPGKSLCRLAGKVVFTDEGLAGEEVEIEPVRERKDYLEARTLEVYKASLQRTTARCRHYPACSPYQYIKYPAQVEIKTEQVKEIFLRQLQIASIKIGSRAAAHIWGYRNKIELQVIWEDNRPHLAYNLPTSRERFVKLNECFLVSGQVNRLLRLLHQIVAEKRLDFISRIAVREKLGGRQLLVAVYCRPGQNLKRRLSPLRVLSAHFPLKGIVGIDKDRGSRSIIYGEDCIQEELEGKTFHLGAESFFQVNLPMLKCLLKDLKAALALKGNETIADLYCGVGTFGIILAPDVRKVSGVELSQENITFLKKNIALNGIKNFSVYKGRCEQWPGLLKKPAADILIVDPPRKGLDKSVCRHILNNPAGLLAYISCNPTTLARDLKRLSRAYQIQSVCFYDFFPHTPHLELLTILKRNCSR